MQHMHNCGHALLHLQLALLNLITEIFQVLMHHKLQGHASPSWLRLTPQNKMSVTPLALNWICFVLLSELLSEPIVCLGLLTSP